MLPLNRFLKVSFFFDGFCVYFLCLSWCKAGIAASSCDDFSLKSSINQPLCFHLKYQYLASTSIYYPIDCHLECFSGNFVKLFTADFPRRDP